MLEYKIINIKKLDFECTRRDFEYILYNEFDLDSRYTDNADELEVYIYEDSDKEMLKKALLKYGAEEEYVESLFESKKENKLSTDNMKKRFNNTVNESATPEDNRLFVRCFNFVTEENWDESDADAKYLFEDGGLDYLMEEVSKESGIVFADKNEFLNYVIENQADLTSDELVAVLVNGAKTNEEGTFESVDEGYCYAKLDDLLAEAREEGRKEALNEAKAWYEDYNYVKPAGISDSEWKELGKKALDWKHGERDENIGACGVEKLRKYYAICSAIKFGGGLSAIEAEAEKRGISLNESNSTIFNLNFDTTSVNEGKKPLTKEDIKVKKEDLKTAKAAFAEKAKAIKSIVKAKGLSELLKFGEEFDVEKLITACNEWFASEGKELKDKKAEVKGLIKELKKLNVTIAVLSAAIEGFKATKTNESVTSRFASGRNNWKGLKLNESEEEGSKEGDGDGDGDNKDNGEGKDKGDEGKDNKEGKEGSDEETEEIDLPAVVITIKKDALDKCKEDMIDAGVEEDDIEELESEDEESDEVDLKIDTNSILALKDYLKDKGIDLEEKLGIEIQEEDDDEDSSKDDEGKDGKKEKEGEGDEDDDELGGLNDDFFASLGDIGGDEGDNK